MYESTYSRHGQRIERKNNCHKKNNCHNKRGHNIIKLKTCKNAVEKFSSLGDNEICKIGSALLLGLVGGITIKTIFDNR